MPSQRRSWHNKDKPPREPFVLHWSLLAAGYHTADISWGQKLLNFKNIFKSLFFSGLLDTVLKLYFKELFIFLKRSFLSCCLPAECKTGTGCSLRPLPSQTRCDYAFWLTVSIWINNQPCSAPSKGETRYNRVHVPHTLFFACSVSLVFSEAWCIIEDRQTAGPHSQGANSQAGKDSTEMHSNKEQLPLAYRTHLENRNSQPPRFVCSANKTVL